MQPVFIERQPRNFTHFNNPIKNVRGREADFRTHNLPYIIPHDSLFNPHSYLATQPLGFVRGSHAYACLQVCKSIPLHLTTPITDWTYFRQRILNELPCSLDIFIAGIKNIILLFIIIPTLTYNYIGCLLVIRITNKMRDYSVGLLRQLNTVF